MREIVLDTETTGLDPESGHRIVEIGAVELIDRLPSGPTFHEYLNPERSMPYEAFKVHGLGDEFLSDKPTFDAVAAEFVAFVGDSPLVIHNAPFDMKFINFELERIGASPIPIGQAVDTLPMAQKQFPGASASLDALCKRFRVDSSRRKKHGALLDSELLAEVYLNLLGGRQARLGLAGQERGAFVREAARQHRPARIFPIASAEEKAHAEFVNSIPNAIWQR